VLVENQSSGGTFPDGGLVYEELGAGDPVGAGADESALLGLLEPAAIQFASGAFAAIARPHDRNSQPSLATLRFKHMTMTAQHPTHKGQ